MLPMLSCILYQNQEKTVILLDIPKSIELAQGTTEAPCHRRLISCKPLEKPFPSIEPKTAKAKAKFEEPSIKTLLLQKHIQFSLEEVKSQFIGPWHLPRVTPLQDHEKVAGEPQLKKRKRECSAILEGSVSKSSETALPSSNTGTTCNDGTVLPMSELPEFYQNRSPRTVILKYTNASGTRLIYIPPNSTFINRFITILESFDLPKPQNFPRSKFNLIVLDPPWPNKSVQRKRNYSTTTTIQSLLNTIPIPWLLSRNGMIALWITNKPAFHTLILDPEEGIFRQWGVELIEEWSWVKVTRDGEPMCEINGTWRKPYETLLVARKIPNDESCETTSEKGGNSIKRRVVFAIPDIHSRKPNLKELFETSGLLGEESGGYEALEIFARNMTAGWWAFGNEVLEFQKDEYWV